MKNPTDLPSQVLAFGDGFGMFPQGGTVLCALSGGVDSMALLALLRELAVVRGLTIHAAHFNHQLRGEESQRDETFVRGWCREQGVPLTVGRGDVAAEAVRLGLGIEETARQLRYAFLEETAAALGGNTRIATAHNADDNAETVLLHLLRGSGLDGLTGIPPRRGRLCRPLLEVPRETLEDYLQDKGIPHVEDSSNAQGDYRRNRLRQQVMPVLRAENPAFVRRLAANLVSLREDRDFLDALGREISDQAAETTDGLSLPIRALGDAPRPAAVRAVKQMFARLGLVQYRAAHLEAVLALVQSEHPSGECALPQGLRVRRQYDRLLFALPNKTTKPSLDTVTITVPGRYEWGDWSVTVTPGVCPDTGALGDRAWYFSAALPLTLRSRQTGDRLRLPGRREKSLKKWFIDERIPQPRRDSLPVLADPWGVLAVGGLGPNGDRLAQAGTDGLLLAVKKERNERQP